MVSHLISSLVSHAKELPTNLTTFMSRKRTLIPFTLGADPEFVCYSKEKKLVYASSTRHASAEEDLGGDGSGRPFEIRPDPAECPYEVVSNIRAILSTHVRRHPAFFDYTWRAGSFHSQQGDRATPIGGHIHVGNSDLDPDDVAPILDTYLGVASSLLQDYEEGRKRKDAGYGEATDIRAQDHGFEYRTCASWMASPHIAAAFLCLTKTVIHQEINTRKARYYENDSVADWINDLDITSMRAHWPSIWTSITKMELYPKYAKHLDLINRLISTKKTWYPKYAMQSAWGIPLPTFHAKHSITLSSLWDPLGGKVGAAPVGVKPTAVVTATTAVTPPTPDLTALATVDDVAWI